MRARLAAFVASAVLALHVVPVAEAGVIGGTVQSVKGNRLVIEYGSDNAVRTFVVPTTAPVARGIEQLSLAKLEVGTKVFVFTTVMGEVYKINVAGPRATPRRPSRTPAADANPAEAGDRPTARGDGPVPARLASERRPERVDVARVWTTFRGPDRANRSAATGLLAEWPEQGPPVAIVHRGLGQGYASVTIADETIFTLGTRGDDELLFALDWNDPRIAWTFRNGRVRRDGTGDGPRGTPTVDGDHVYVLGANGDLACVERADGTTVWRKNVLRDFAAQNITWGISESPLVDGEKLIVTPGGTDATMVALDKTSGRILWRAAVPGNPQAAYASAIVCEVGGVRQYVNFTSKGIIGVKADDGTPLWGENASSNGTANCSTPLFHEGGVFSASGYGTGGALVRLASGRATTRAQLVYKAREMVNHHGGMVIVDDHLYGTNDNSLLCMNLENGEMLWRDRSVGKGSITYADGHLYLVGEKGEIALVEATPRGYVEKGRFAHVNRSNRPLWAHPVVHEGRLLIRDQDTLTAYDIAAE